jgi:hypothetical protein
MLRKLPRSFAFPSKCSRQCDSPDSQGYSQFECDGIHLKNLSAPHLNLALDVTMHLCVRIEINGVL